MTAKLSATIGDATGEALRQMADDLDVNQSVVTEAALVHFFKVPASDRNRLINAMNASKKAYTRTRWRLTFWDGVFDEFWFPLELRARRRSDFTPLTFAGFQIWILTDGVENFDREDAPFSIVAAANAMSTHVSPETKRDFSFARNDSPYDAAQSVVGYIRECVAASNTFEFVELPDGLQVQLDHAGHYWMARPGSEPLRLPITIDTHAGSYTLEERHLLRRLH